MLHTLNLSLISSSSTCSTLFVSHHSRYLAVNSYDLLSVTLITVHNLKERVHLEHADVEGRC
jgi:hypothetical protein